jgi:hypothetical protein
MKSKLFLVILLCFAICRHSAFAFVDQDSLVQLSLDPTWGKLLHFEDSSHITSSVSSAISSPEFFLSKNGNLDLLKELQATVSALLATGVAGEALDVQCRFPARTLWLKKQLPEMLSNVRQVACPAFENWSKNGNTHSLSIVYATGFLGNPASFYGHTLLKLNSSDNEETTPLVDVSVNYGALVPEDENPIVYILKGIFGGYDGAFSHLQYFYHNHNYGEAELRDLWEYELNLNQEQVDFILAHTWEILGKSFTYYFFRENCGFRMAEMLELIEGVEIIPKNPIWTMPQSIMQKLANAKVDHKPLVKAIHRTPSRQSRFYDAFKNLNSNEKVMVKLVIDNEGQANNSNFLAESDSSQHRVLDTLLHYYQFLRKKHNEPDLKIEKAYRRVLSTRFMLPKGKAIFNEASSEPPHEGRPPSLTRLAVMNESASGGQLELTIRPAYYDQLDAEQTHIPKASLKMGQLRFLKRNGNYLLRQLDLIDVQSLNTRATGLPEDSAEAWKLNVGWHRPTLNCRNCMAFTIQADAGYLLPISDNWQLAGYVGGSVSEGNGIYGHGQLRATIELQGQITPDINLFILAKKNHYLDAQANSDERYDVTLRYRLSRNWDLRFHLRNQHVTEVGSSIGYYW